MGRRFQHRTKSAGRTDRDPGREKYCKAYNVRSAEKDGLGWDLEATPSGGGATICIEVKGLFGEEVRAGVTPNEYRTLVHHMKGDKPHYRFCVLTNSLSDKPTLTILRYQQKADAWFDDVSGERTAVKIDRLESAIISIVLPD